MWYEIKVVTTSEAVEAVSYVLDSMGAEGVWIEDPEDPVYQEGSEGDWDYMDIEKVKQDLDFEGAMNAVWKGLERAKTEFNMKPSVVKKSEPQFNYGIIVCAMRFCNEHFSPFYKSFFEHHKYSEPIEVIQLASIELAKASAQMIQDTGIPIVAFDLAGAEKGYPADDHIEAYRIAHRNFIRKTVHAGESYGPESIFQAITDLHADRIGHGFYLFDHTRIMDEKNLKDPEGYVRELIHYIADNRITLEVCPTSNLQTIPDLNNDIKNHPVGKMLEQKLSVTICTDNTLISNTTVTKELQKVIKAFEVPIDQLKSIIAYGFKRSFYAHSYIEKRKYVRSVLDYFDKIVDEFFY